MTAPTLLVVGPAQHGVTEYAATLAATVDEINQFPSTFVLRPGGEPDEVPGSGPVHLHVTDKLFGDHPAQAADWVEALAATRLVTLTLHDLPQPSDGLQSMARRAASYRRMVAVAAGVVCSSRHEAALLTEFTAEPAAAVRVIPLALPALAPIASPPGPPLPVAALLGFVYPGKGHPEVIEAVAAAGLDLGVMALGAPSDGHEQDAVALQAKAAALSVPFTITGYLPRPELLDLCRRVAVPVAAHQHVSASASVNTWIAAGRRPLVPDSRYTREMADLRPGTLWLYQPDDLVDMLRQAATRPALTRPAPDVGLGPDLRETALQYLSWWRQVLA